MYTYFSQYNTHVNTTHFISLVDTVLWLNNFFVIRDPSRLVGSALDGLWHIPKSVFFMMKCHASYRLTD